jgi:hypothetical protein
LAKLGRDSLQFVPPNTHRANEAERAMRTAKNHIIGNICGAPADCPLDLWDKPIAQYEITLNLLRPWRPNPVKSAYEGLYGQQYDGQHTVPPDGMLDRLHYTIVVSTYSCLQQSASEHRTRYSGFPTRTTCQDRTQ